MMIIINGHLICRGERDREREEKITMCGLRLFIMNVKSLFCKAKARLDNPKNVV